ncbi:MAG TPA: hypothetical protein PKB15_04400 [Acidimicrobiia bacterium]|nr:hypothetical protein [Acidimicrobiia bacterium]
MSDGLRNISFVKPPTLVFAEHTATRARKAVVRRASNLENRIEYSKVIPVVGAAIVVAGPVACAVMEITGHGDTIAPRQVISPAFAAGVGGPLAGVCVMGLSPNGTRTLVQGISRTLHRLPIGRGQ